ncbi:class I SAM-dependent methyltransferase [Prosthecobacter fusiformis]|nr:class I SAM-dependent methyltransferase [Prosthecobacter fusiformis]
MFRTTLHPHSQDRILDVGGYPDFWTRYEAVAGGIDCLNVHEVAWDSASFPKHGIRVLVGDGCALTAEDGAYDILFSNSVIEHVRTWEEQQAFAREARRVGKDLWIQTPAYECPIEPHYLGLYIHHLPKKWQRRLIRWVTLWGWVQRPTQEQIDSEIHTLRLISRKEMDILFPDCEILTERLLGIFPKSYIAVRKGRADRR